MRVAFIINPRSGARRRGLPIEAQIAEAAHAAGLTFELSFTSSSNHAEALARAASHDRFDVVAAVGGDGTANDVARGLIGGSASLAVVPCGSGNGFARDHGMSLVPARAVRQIATGRRRRIDVGEIDGRPFLMTAGFGIDARVVHRFAREAGETRGQWPYFRLGVAEYLRYRPRPLTLDLDGERRTESALLLVVANTRQFGAGAVIAPGAIDDDGLLDLVIVPPLPLLRLGRCAAKLFTGELDLAPGVTIRRFARLDLGGDGPLEAQLDGEPHGFGRRVTIACRPRALNLWVPG